MEVVHDAMAGFLIKIMAHKIPSGTGVACIKILKLMKACANNVEVLNRMLVVSLW
jgi:hypothetical protein